MKLLAVEVTDETYTEVETLAATANLSRDEFVAEALRTYAARQRRKAARDAEIKAEYDAIGDAPEIRLSPAQQAGRNARWRELGEW